MSAALFFVMGACSGAVITKVAIDLARRAATRGMKTITIFYPDHLRVEDVNVTGLDGQRLPASGPLQEDPQ